MRKKFRIISTTCWKNLSVERTSRIFPLDFLISKCVEIDGELSEIGGFFKAMEVEIDSMISTERQKNQTKLDGYAEEYKQASEAFKELRNRAKIAARKNEEVSAARKELVTANARLDKSTNSIQMSQISIAESEKIGYVIMSDLENQKEMLIGAGGNVNETKQRTFDARRVLHQISKGLFMRKVFLVVIISLLALSIWMLIYYKIKVKKR